MVWESILTGLLAGAAWSFTGYGEKRVLEEQSFDPAKLLETLAVGAFIGGIGAALGVSPSSTQEWGVQAALMGGAVPFAKKALNALKPYLHNLLEYIKTR